MDASDQTSLLAAIDGMRKNLAAMASQLMAAAGRLHGAVSDLTMITTGLQEGAREESAAVSVVTAALQQLTAGIADIAAQAGEAERLAAASVEQTQAGNKSLSRMIGELTAAESAIGEMTETAKE